MDAMTTMRIESDAFGAIEIPADRYWGAQTQRALGVFEIGEERFPACLIHAFGFQKIAPPRPHPPSPPPPATKTNIKANGSIPSRAKELLGQPLGTKSPVHPNDHVNASQSSNDSFPT